MIKKWLTLLCLLTCQTGFSWVDLEWLSREKNIITEMRQINFKRFPGAHNPSLIRTERGFLLTFRYLPDPDKHWISHIGIVELDAHLQPVAEPIFLNTRGPNSQTPSQAEDARLFTFQNRLFVIYNDNLDVEWPKQWDRRDMFLAELHLVNGQYELLEPVKLHYPQAYNYRFVQKNWTPFEYQGELFLSYTLNPHLVLHPNLTTGECNAFYESWFSSEWEWGEMRGSSQALLVDGEYLSFFHSGTFDYSEASFPFYMWHYFMGAYTFSAAPPFEITKMSPSPILTPGLYTPSGKGKRVVFPGSFAVDDSQIYLACGKDDCEIWILTINKEELKKSMQLTRAPDL